MDVAPKSGGTPNKMFSNLIRSDSQVTLGHVASPNGKTSHDVKCAIRLAIRRIHDEQPGLVAAVQASLEGFIRKERPMLMSRFPREHFTQEQHCLIAIDYYDRISRRRLNFLDLREDLSNLACLYEFLVMKDERSGHNAARLLSKLLHITAEFAFYMEHYSKMRKTNWYTLCEVYAGFIVEPEPPAVSVVLPRLRHISQIRLIGAGGFGAIYKVMIGGIALIGKLVPCSKFKTTRQASADKLVGSIVNSPFLVKYHACFRSDQAYVTVMEYIRGVDLHRVIKSSALSDRVNKIVMAQLGLALQYLHYRGFIHRDVKPSNIMFMPGGKVKLIDFDTCKICAGRYVQGHINSYIRKSHNEFDDNESAGTLYFLPPEVLDKKPYGRAIDWWALGITSFRLCAGKLPFRANTRKSLKDKIREGHVTYGFGDPIHEELTKRLLLRQPTHRLTSGRFEEFRNHEWFSVGIDWAKIESDAFIEEVTAVNDMMDFHDGQFTPRDDCVTVTEQKQQEALSFNDLDDVDPQEQEPLFTLMSQGFRSVIQKIEAGLVVSEADIFEEPELIRDNYKFCKYKFHNYLQVKSSKHQPSVIMSPQASNSVNQISDSN